MHSPFPESDGQLSVSNVFKKNRHFRRRLDRRIVCAGTQESRCRGAGGRHGRTSASLERARELGII